VWIVRARNAKAAKAPPPKPFGTIALGVGLFVGIGGIARAILVYMPEGIPEPWLIAGTLAGIAVASAVAILLAEKAANAK
jgi:hypothetical protein